MCAGSGDREADAVGRGDQLAPRPENVFLQLGDIAADLGTDFDDRLVQLALDGGGHDNVTVIVASFEFPPAASV